MLTLKKIAITGGLSSGKSLACQIFKEFGAYVVDSDEVVHQLLKHETELGKKVIALLGSDVVVDRIIDRSKIAKKVFQNPELLKSLETLLHPAVLEEIEDQYQNVKNAGKYTQFVAEVPLLFEIEAQGKFDVTIAVIANEEICRRRFHDKKEYERRMTRQLTQEDKAIRADIVIHNDGTIEQLKNQIKKIYNQLK